MIMIYHLPVRMVTKSRSRPISHSLDSSVRSHFAWSVTVGLLDLINF